MLSQHNICQLFICMHERYLSKWDSFPLFWQLVLNQKRIGVHLWSPQSAIGYYSTVANLTTGSLGPQGSNHPASRPSLFWILFHRLDSNPAPAFPAIPTLSLYPPPSYLQARLEENKETRLCRTPSCVYCLLTFGCTQRPDGSLATVIRTVPITRLRGRTRCPSPSPPWHMSVQLTKHGRIMDLAGYGDV